LRLIANRNKKNIQFDFRSALSDSSIIMGRDLLSAGPTLDCNSCHRQGLDHKMELPIGEPPQVCPRRLIHGNPAATLK